MSITSEPNPNAGSANLDVSITQSGNTVTVSATGSASSKKTSNFSTKGGSFVEANFTLKYQLKKPGVLTVVVNRSWGSGGYGGRVRLDSGLGTMFFPIDQNTTNFYTVTFGRFDLYPLPYEERFYINLTGLRCPEPESPAAADYTPATGSGEVFTITFTPV